MCWELAQRGQAEEARFSIGRRPTRVTCQRRGVGFLGQWAPAPFLWLWHKPWQPTLPDMRREAAKACACSRPGEAAPFCHGRAGCTLLFCCQWRPPPRLAAVRSTGLADGRGQGLSPCGLSHRALGEDKECSNPGARPEAVHARRRPSSTLAELLALLWQRWPGRVSPTQVVHWRPKPSGR